MTVVTTNPTNGPISGSPIIDSSGIGITDSSGKPLLDTGAMPNLVGFSLNYALGLLASLGAIPVLQYVAISPPQTTVGIVMSHNPPAGNQVNGTIVLTVSGGVKWPGIGTSVFSQPAILTANDDDP